MEEIELLNFRQIIEDEGCVSSHSIVQGGIIIQYYLSWDKSTSVPVNITAESMTARTAAGLLMRLGLEDVIERLGLKFD
jgi:hypothetical protein